MVRFFFSFRRGCLFHCQIDAAGAPFFSVSNTEGASLCEVACFCSRWPRVIPQIFISSGVMTLQSFLPLFELFCEVRKVSLFFSSSHVFRLISLLYLGDSDTFECVILLRFSCLLPVRLASSRD